jgi:nucleoside-diphosphate-sugar epimerase
MYLIFGATGFIGRALQSALVERRVPFFGFGSKVCVRGDGTAVAQLDNDASENRAALLQELPPPQAIVFAAGTAMTGTDAGVLQASHFGSLQEAFADIPPRWWKDLPFIYTSSCTVYERSPRPLPLLASDPVAPNSAYAEVKLRCERFVSETLASFGARIAVARLFNVSGFGQRGGIVSEIAQQAVEIQSNDRSAFRLRTNEPILDLIDVNEAAAALLALAEAKNIPEVVNVCSGRPVTTEDLITAARNAIGREAPITYTVETDRRHMLVGNPDLMIARTGWRARRSVDEIVAAVIAGRQLAGAAT